jgi:hypothetical protein
MGYTGWPGGFWLTTTAASAGVPRWPTGSARTSRRRGFKAHHLDITLRMLPVSPSLVGTVVYTDASSSAVESEVTMIYAKCASAPSGGNRCAVGIKIPLDFHGQYAVDFGRAARPGEAYVSTNSASASGEDHQTTGSSGQFSGTWYVNDALPYKPGEVMLFVSRSESPTSAPGSSARG